MAYLTHLQNELSQNSNRVSVATRYGSVIGGRTSNGAAVFLEIPYALPPKRFTDPEPLPPDHRYEEREYVKETFYAAQPDCDRQATSVPYEHRVGLGQPTENPLFLNVFIPPSFPTQNKFPVKVYFHQGFLQYGSPHALSAQAQYVCAEMSEVWVNIGYRLSAFGFLASHKPKLNGNYGFKDQWLALKWIKANIESFGGDPDNIQIQGHSAGSFCDLGSHSIHQQLHRASCLPDGDYAPFQCAILQSNAMLSDPKIPEELQPQFDAFCKALKLNPESPDILDTLRDPVKVPWMEITKVIETEALGVEHGIFRACLSDDWIQTEPGPMERQRNGQFARGLRERGVQSIVVGEVSDEWYNYSFSHSISSPQDVGPTLRRYFPDSVSNKLIRCFDESKNEAEAKMLFGSLLAYGLVHLPIRLLHKDLLAADFPVMRYRIEWIPEQLHPEKVFDNVFQPKGGINVDRLVDLICAMIGYRPEKEEKEKIKGHVPHASDRVIWSLLTPLMTSDQVDVARIWLKTLQDEVTALKAQKPESKRSSSAILTLTKSHKIQWSVDDGSSGALVAKYSRGIPAIPTPVARNITRLQDELRRNNDRISVVTRYGPVIGGRTSSRIAVFLEIPYALPPKRFTDPEPLPPDHQYEEKEYIKENSYAVQPNCSDGQETSLPRKHRVGLGQPTENPLFLNIYVPPSFPSQQKFPVKVYFHEGFLQSGSPHALSAQASQYVCAEMSEVWVNIGYRLSAFGFLASHKPKLTGNYGFKDQWLALQWIKANIESFGGDPDNIQIQGHSAGSYCDLSSHSIHQQLHRASCLPEGEHAPFQSAILQSNAMLSDPKTAEELQPQFDALCKALKLDPDSSDILDILRDPVKVPWTEIMKVVETEALGIKHGIFRACLSVDWIQTEPGPMERQRNGEFARGLRERGIQSIVVGEVSDEWYNYSFSHPIYYSPLDIGEILERYFPDRIANNIIKCFGEAKKRVDMTILLSRFLAAGLVHLPIRLLHKDLLAAGFPVMRYRIEWIPEQLRPNNHEVCTVADDCPQQKENQGHVPGASDRFIWSFFTPLMTSDQVDVTRSWLKAVQDEVATLKAQKPESRRNSRTLLCLKKDRKIEWGQEYGSIVDAVAKYPRGIPALPVPVVYDVTHLQDQLTQSNDRISVATRYGPIIGGRTSNGVAVFLEIPYALPPKRFTDPEPLPIGYRYEEKEYIKETSYAAQPNYDGEAENVPYKRRVGLGQPTENPLFLNLFIPPSFPTQQKFPVKVYFHEGFLQFGSPHAVSAQAQYVCAEMSEVWVNIGYRLSAFGFLASHKPKLTGNYGFKDQWLALQWIKLNIESFGGDPDNIQLQGHSIGSLCDPSSHSIHQQLHKVSCLPEGERAPFQSAVLQSNAMMLNPRNDEGLQPQFDALCKALKLKPYSDDILDTLRDPVKVPWTAITKVIESEVLGIEHGIFRACLSNDWIHTEPGPMERQKQGDFARGLRERGVRNVMVGELKDEWYIYSVSHPISSPQDVKRHLTKHFPERIVNRLMLCFREISNDEDPEVAQRLFGQALSCALVHLPIRILQRDLLAAGFPVIRYLIEWTPEQLRPNGCVTPPTDRAIWSLLTPFMTSEQIEVARSWLKAVQGETAALSAQEPEPKRGSSDVLKLTRNKRIEWSVDKEYDDTLGIYERGSSQSTESITYPLCGHTFTTTNMRYS